MKEATCATCPWWEEYSCHHESMGTPETGVPGDWWCSAHPDRKLPDVHEMAARAMQALVPQADELAALSRVGPENAVAHWAYGHAVAMLAEAKRRQGCV